MTVFRMGSRGPDVETIQRRLNCAGRTRLARLSTDGDFGFFTAVRVREFQHYQGLDNDGAVGPATLAQLERFPTTCTTAPAPSRRVIVVNLDARRGYIYQNGRRVRTIGALIGGLESDASRRSDRGVFMASSCDRDHRSSQYGGAPMNYSVFYNRGEAFHQGSTTSASHGCIHLAEDDARWVFDWVLSGARAAGESASDAEARCFRANVMVIVGP